MDRTTNHTTRKGFFKRAGIAIAGVFALKGAAQAATSVTDESPKSSTFSAANELPAMSRVRKAKGAVARSGSIR